MGLKTTALVLAHIVKESIRHPLTPSTIYVDPGGKVRVVNGKKKKSKKTKGGSAVVK